jgi:hypothetical protein
LLQNHCFRLTSTLWDAAICGHVVIPIPAKSTGSSAELASQLSPILQKIHGFSSARQQAKAPALPLKNPDASGAVPAAEFLLPASTLPFTVTPCLYY